MGRNELVNAIREEIKVRPAGQAIEIGALAQAYGREILVVLWDLRREFRLVELGTGIDLYTRDNGYERADLIHKDDGMGRDRWFITVESLPTW